jgi:hypothetical protein
LLADLDARGMADRVALTVEARRQLEPYRRALWVRLVGVRARAQDGDCNGERGT